MSIKKPFLIILFFLFGFSASALASNGDTVSSFPLTHEEEETLLFMREEEKLARDVYLTLYGFWESHDGSSIFKNIAESEQLHMDALKTLLDKYQLDDPAQEAIGEFTNQDLQTLYNELLARGQESYLGALEVGILIEEKDMVDIQLAIDEAKHPDLINVYSNLLDGSKNHLLAFLLAKSKI